MQRENISKVLTEATAEDLAALDEIVRKRKATEAAAAKAERLGRGIVVKIRVSGDLARKLIGGGIVAEHQPAAVMATFG